MINRREIINNAKACAERFVESHFEMSAKANYGVLKEQMTKAEIWQLDNFVNVRMPARIRKEGRVSFRNVDLNLIASKARAFQSLHDSIALYNLRKHGRHDEGTTLAFLADCMMIKECGDAREPQMSKLPKAKSEAIQAILWDVLEIFELIVSSYGITYFEDLQDRTLELASEVVNAEPLPLAA